MPLPPKGISKALFDRIRDQVSKQFQGRDPQPEQPGQPALEPGSLLDRIRQRVRERFSPKPETVPAYWGPPRTLGEVKQRIELAGRNNPPVLLRMRYNNNWRNVEPYSFRYRDKDDPHIPLFFGYCHKDQGIEAFKLRRVQDLQVTNQPYKPRWPIEV